MKNKWLPLLLVLVVCCKTTSAQTDSSHLRISILTCALGNELYSTFGHTAIRVTDSSQQTDFVYNYGTFDFNDPDFYSKFTRGKLDYFLSVATLPQFMYEYQVENRDVSEQELRLTDSVKRAIVTALNENIAGSARYYKYDFLYDNCTSRVRDILIKYAGLKADQPLVPANTSFRNMLHEYLDKGAKSWSKLGIDLLLGSPTDQLVNIPESMFLPDYLMKGIDSSVHSKPSGILEQKILLNKGIQSREPFRNRPFYFFSVFALLVAGISFIRHKAAQKLTKAVDFILFFATGLIGFLLLFLWFGTDHKSYAANYNLLWALPTHLIAAFALWKNPRWLQKYFSFCSVLYLLLLLFYFFLPQQLNTGFIPFIILLLFRSLQWRKK